MKIYRPYKNVRRLLSFLLCCLLVTGCLGLTVSAGEDELSSLPEPVEETVAEADDESVDETVDGDVNETPAELEPQPGDGEDVPEDPDTPEDPDAPEDPETITVTYDFGEFGLVTESVEPGQTPKNVPDVPEEFAWQGYVVDGWLTKSGEPADPYETAVTEDTVYTARLKRSVDALLITDEHKEYIHGKTPEMFDPQGDLTRAEAANLFSNLLRDKSFSYSITFKDVPSDPEKIWYAEAVGRMAALNIVKGFDDGTFRPNVNITRAEFVKMAVPFDGLVEGAECPFPDVDKNHWARDEIASAYAKGWVLGDNKGKFNPGSNITRAEAVTLLNRILGRQPDENIENKKGVRVFCDVFPNWAYGHIIEAATEHSFITDESGTEHWTDYTRYSPTSKRGWLSLNGKRYYIGSDGKCLRGAQTINGAKYRFDNNGAAVTGFFTESGWKRYYKNGALVEDISNLGLVKDPYYIKVYKPANYLIVFAKDSSGKYNIPVRSMLTSCGNPTPTGNFYTPNRFRWLEMVGGSWAQWCTQIEGSYLFHSVPNDLKNNYTMWSSEYNNLGTTRSLGCIRLTCEDAKWIYDNCVLGTHVYISPTESSGPLKKPAGIKIPSWHTWDPTDPTAKYLCKQHGCH